MQCEKKRCQWALGSSEEMEYHDIEWGVPQHDDRALFEFLILEGMQAGLSWVTILRKRENFRAAFDGFDPAIVAGYTDDKLEQLMQDSGIIRNRRKIWSARDNAKAFLKIQKEYGSFDAFIWAYVDGKPIINSVESMEDMPSDSDLSKRISKDLRKLGFNFVGPTIMYAFMQAVGMVDDHANWCAFKSEMM